MPKYSGLSVVLWVFFLDSGQSWSQKWSSDRLEIVFFRFEFTIARTGESINMFFKFEAFWVWIFLNQPWKFGTVIICDIGILCDTGLCWTDIYILRLWILVNLVHLSTTFFRSLHGFFQYKNNTNTSVWQIMH